MTRRFNFDLLNKILLAAALLLLFLPLGNTSYLLAGAVLAVFFIRGYSSDTYKRAQENMRVINFFKSVKNKFSFRKAKTRPVRPIYSSTEDNRDSEYVIFKCRKCKQKLRVPKGKGKIIVTCSKCGNKMKKRT